MVCGAIDGLEESSVLCQVISIQLIIGMVFSRQGLACVFLREFLFTHLAALHQDIKQFSLVEIEAELIVLGILHAGVQRIDKSNIPLIIEQEFLIILAIREIITG